MSQSLLSEEKGAKVATAENPVETRAAARRRKSPAKLIVFLVILAAIGVGVYMAYLHFKDRVSTDDANVDGHIASIAPKISGNVVEVAVLDNQPVKAGDVLVRIDPRDYQAAVDQAKAAVGEAESRLHAAKTVVPLTDETTLSATSGAAAQLADAQVEVERARLAYEQSTTSDLAFAEANVRTRQANYDRAQADLERMKPLVDKAEISRLQYDSYVAAQRVSEGELRAAQEKLGSAQKDAGIRKSALDAAQTRVKLAQSQVESSLANRKQVDVRNADAGTAAAAVQSANARLAEAILRLSYTTITSPIDGVVTRKSVEVGNIVQPGQGLMTVIPLQDTWVTANFKETQLADVHPGQHAEIHIDMYGKSISGHVDSISGATGSRMSLLPPENATGNFVKVVQRIPVKILVDKSDGLILRPGMNVDVTIFTR